MSKYREQLNRIKQDLDGDATHGSCPRCGERRCIVQTRTVPVYAGEEPPPSEATRCHACGAVLPDDGHVHRIIANLPTTQRPATGGERG